MKRFSTRKLLALFLALAMALAAFPAFTLSASAASPYVFDLAAYIAGMPDGPLGEEGAGTATLGTTHGVANTNLALGTRGGHRYVLVDRTQANATRGLLLQGIDFEVGDVVILHGFLVTDGLDMRLQAASGSHHMPTRDEMDVPGDGATEGAFRIEYTVTDIFAEEATAGGMRVVAHNQAIPAQFRLYGLTVARGGAGAQALPEGYIFSLSTYMAGLPLGVLGEDGGGTDTVGTTHGAENSNLAIGVTDGTRYLQVNRTQANATRGLLLRGIEYEVGDIIVLEGTLFTPGLDMRLQAASGSHFMPSRDEMGVPGDGATEGVFRIEYTVTDIFAEEANAGGMRVVAHGQGIPAQFRLYTQPYTVPTPMPFPSPPGPRSSGLSLMNLM